MLWLLVLLGLAVVAGVLVFNWRERRSLRQLAPVRRDPVVEAPPSAQPTPFLPPNPRLEWSVWLEPMGSQSLKGLLCPARIGTKPARLRMEADFSGCLVVPLATRQGGLTLDDHEAMVGQIQSWEAAGLARAADALPSFADLVRPAREAEAQLLDLDGQLMFHLQSDEPPSAETLSAYCQQLGLSQRGEGRFSMLDAEGQVVFSTMPADQGLLLSFLLDLPRVQDPESAFVDMGMTARSLADAIGAEIVDDRGLVLTEQSMTLVREQVRQRAEALSQAGLPAGGPLARSLFQ
ncbi:MAG: cell division protein ZipA C-terminal FtsZ-binding domain-containing protein [Burkholderiaceae bacterium]